MSSEGSLTMAKRTAKPDDHSNREASSDLEQIDTIPVSKTTEICFFFDTYHGKRYANIRKFARSDRYTGATKQGIKLSRENLDAIVKSRSGIIDCAGSPEEKELCRSPKIATIDIVVKMVLYEGQYGLDFREIFKTAGGEGFGKGIRLKFESIPRAMEILEAMMDRFDSRAPETPGQVKEPSPPVDQDASLKLPGHVKRYF
jgi:hypothetical protein